ncbi:MAG: hypothetical protein ABR568_13390 [Pyrinomonadaceae bacterium]
MMNLLGYSLEKQAMGDIVRGEQNLGNLITIEKAVGEDFERVYPLLLEFNVPGITREDWLRLFTNNWRSSEDFCGYLLLGDGEVKGFLGLLFSTRTINGKREKFCNLTSWIVREQYRNHSLRLLLEALKLQSYTITNFTPSNTVAAILKKVGFTEMETAHRILFPIPSAFMGHSNHRCVFDLENIRHELNERDRAIFDDHCHLPCRHVLISSENDYCYLVFKNKVHRHLPFARSHHVSNRPLFRSAIDSVRNKICWKLKIAGLMVDERYLGGSRFKYSSEYPQQCPAFFRSATVGHDDIDTLYSEMILLHD